MTRQELIDELANIIIETTGLTDITPRTLNEDTALMGGELGLDSVDMLSCVVALEHKYSMSIMNKDEGRAIFKNLGSIADYIQQHQKK